MVAAGARQAPLQRRERVARRPAPEKTLPGQRLAVACRLRWGKSRTGNRRPAHRGQARQALSVDLSTVVSPHGGAIQRWVLAKRKHRALRNIPRERWRRRLPTGNGSAPP